MKFEDVPRQTAADIRATRRAALREVMKLGPSLRDTIRDSRDAVREGMMDLRWAMEHPFAGKRYIRFLADNQEAANRELVRALRQGKTDAAAKAQEIVWAIQQELAKLKGVDFAMRVGVDLDFMRPPGAPPPPKGRRKAGAHGATFLAGDWGMVGEAGPERIRNVRGAAIVEPLGRGGGGGPIYLMVDGQVLARSVDRRLGDAWSLTRAGRQYRGAD